MLRKMIRKILVEEDVELCGAECWIHPRCWSTSEINGVKDDNNEPKMPLIEEHLGELSWHIIVNLDNGQIGNWPKGTVASIHYKSCDENYVQILDDQLGIVKDYEGYVPNFLCNGQGHGDYVILEIDEDGFIKNFNNNLDDIFNDDEDDDY